MNRALLGLLVAVSSWGAGAGRVAGFSADWERGTLRIRETGTPRAWSVDVARLSVRLTDCEVEEECGPGEACFGVCIRRAQLVGADAPRRRVYFTVDTGSSRNPPKVLFEYDLTARRARRVSVEAGSGFTLFRISPDGRYLAYAMAWHHGLTCPPVSSASVVDLRAGKRASVGGWVPEGTEQRQFVEVTGLEWVNGSGLRAEARIRDAQCSEAVLDRVPQGESKRQTVNAGALQYR